MWVGRPWLNTGHIVEINLNFNPYASKRNFEQVKLFDFKILTFELAAIFLNWICLKHCKSYVKSLGDKDYIKGVTFLSWSAKTIDTSVLTD